MRRRFIDTERNNRLCDVKDANVIYYWSLKQNMILCSSDLEKNNSCEVCIPLYPSCKECVFKFTNLSALKEHLYYCENKWKRELVWAKREEIPLNLKRKREIGDLSSLEDSEILRIHLDDKIVIKRRKDLKNYLRKNINQFKSLNSVKDTNLTYSFCAIFDRLSELERLNKDYLIFEATETDLSRNESINRVIESPKASSSFVTSSKKMKKDISKNSSELNKKYNLTETERTNFVNRLYNSNIESIIDGIVFEENNQKFKIFSVDGKYDLQKLDETEKEEEFSIYKCIQNSINSKLDNETKLALKRKFLEQ